MSSCYADPFARLGACLEEIAAIDPTYRTTGEKQHALVGLSRFIARAEAARIRILTAADDIADATGHRSTAHWLADQTRDHPTVLRRHAELGSALEARWPLVAAGFAAGRLNLAQTRAIVEALDTLPDHLADDPADDLAEDLAEDLRAKAEALLVAEAAELGPRELRLLGGRLLEKLAPDIADRAEYRRLLAEEHRASAATRLTLRRRGDGSTDLHARLPDHAAGRLRAYLDAFTAPRRHHLDTPFGPLHTPETDEFGRLPADRQRGIAFQALLENTPTRSLPRHGGTATSVMVTLDYQTLVRDTSHAGVDGVASTSTGERVTAGQARRLACQAGLIPIVLGGRSEVLDVGRHRRLVTEPIRKALNLRDRGCTTHGCTMPAEFCEAHHVVPWSRGGTTSLHDTKLLCPFHHHRAHDPDWIAHHHPNAKTSFTRRT